MNDDGVINLRGEKSDEQPEFRIKKDPSKMGAFASVKPVNPERGSSKTGEPSNQVRVKFDKFVNLVANHAYEDVIDRYRGEEVIISTDLLTDLANTVEDSDSRKVPLNFLIGGLVIGVIITWIILKN